MAGWLVEARDLAAAIAVAAAASALTDSGHLHLHASVVCGLLKKLSAMTIFDLLSRRQREITVLFRQIYGRIADGEEELAQVAFRRLTVKLIAKMRAEQAVVYPRFAFLGLADEVRDALSRHDDIEQTINHLRLTRLRVEDWRRVFELLDRLVTKHYETLEAELLPFAHMTVPRSDADQIARDYVTFEQLAVPVAGTAITYDAVSASA